MEYSLGVVILTPSQGQRGQTCQPWGIWASPARPGRTGLALLDCLADLILAYLNAYIPMSLCIPMYSYTIYGRYLAIFILFHRKVL